MCLRVNMCLCLCVYLCWNVHRGVDCLSGVCIPEVGYLDASMLDYSTYEGSGENLVTTPFLVFLRLILLLPPALFAVAWLSLLRASASWISTAAATSGCTASTYVDRRSTFGDIRFWRNRLAATLFARKAVHAWVSARPSSHLLRYVRRVTARSRLDTACFNVL